LSGSCEAPQIAFREQEYRTTCERVTRNNLGGSLAGVTGPNELAAARRISGVEPTDAFAVRHGESHRQCPDERPNHWFLVHRVDLSRAAVEDLRRHVDAPAL
jgi:hypothetical protein